MIDIEKVIRGLEVCLAADLTKDENPCAPCPYFFDGMCQNAIKEDALALLKEQKSVVHCKDCIYKPTATNGKHGVEYVFPYEYKCPCQCDDDWYSWMPDDDWFCANGEREVKKDA